MGRRKNETVVETVETVGTDADDDVHRQIEAGGDPSCLHSWGPVEYAGQWGYEDDQVESETCDICGLRRLTRTGTRHLPIVSYELGGEAGGA